MKIEDYPNLQAIIGRISGHFTEWPMIRIELRKLLKRINELEKEQERREKIFDETIEYKFKLIIAIQEHKRELDRVWNENVYLEDLFPNIRKINQKLYKVLEKKGGK